MVTGTTVPIEVNATSLTDISKVEFYLQDSFAYGDTTIPYEWSWDTTKYPNGAYTVTVSAFDDAGQSITKRIQVVVKNSESPPWPLISICVTVGIGVTSITIALLGYRRRK